MGLGKKESSRQCGWEMETLLRGGKTLEYLGEKSWGCRTVGRKRLHDPSDKKDGTFLAQVKNFFPQKKGAREHLTETHWSPAKQG